jgi:hypothetical protein
MLLRMLQLLQMLHAIQPQHRCMRYSHSIAACSRRAVALLLLHPLPHRMRFPYCLAHKQDPCTRSTECCT